MRDRPLDTEPAVMARWQALIAALGGGERVRLAAEMFQTGRALVEARVRQEASDVGEPEIRARVFERLYGRDLDAATLARVAARLRRDVR